MQGSLHACRKCKQGLLYCLMACCLAQNMARSKCRCAAFPAAVLISGVRELL